MTVHTDLTRADWITFYRFANRSAFNRWGRLRPWWIWLGGGASVGFALSFSGIELHSFSLLVGAPLSILTVAIGLEIQLRAVIPSRGGLFLGQRQVTVEEDCLRETSQWHELQLRWSCVRCAELTAQHLFIMADNHAAILVPVESFSNDDERDRFAAEIRTRAASAAAIPSGTLGKG